MTLHGFHRRFLRINLTTGGCRTEPLLDQYPPALLGGAGFAIGWLLQFAPVGVDPLSPENPLIFASTPLVDSGITTTSRVALATRSPLTGWLGDSLLSSHFAVALRRAGWDGWVITGRTPALSVLVVDPGGISIVPSPELAGLSAAETETVVTGRLPGYRVCAVGPAGEAGVRFATVSHHGRHAGRTGLGTALGAHGLKAIAVTGDRRLVPFNPAAVSAWAARLRERSLGPDTAKYRLLGTSANLHTFQRLGVLPERNFQSVAASQPAESATSPQPLSGEYLAESHRRERSGCAYCTIGCEHRFEPAGDQKAVRAEYESLFAMGPLLGISDPDQVLRLASKCDELGVDTLSAGGTLAWAMECFERGVLTRSDTGGLELRFGSFSAAISALEQLGNRQGSLGELLAEGSARAAARLGRGSEAWAMQVKGLELPGYEPRALKTLGLGLAVGARGACHNRSSGYERDFASGKPNDPAHPLNPGAEAAASESRAAVLDALGVCKFLRHCLDDPYADLADLFQAITGVSVEAADLAAAGDRIVTLKRLFNQREGAGREQDLLPERFFDQPLRDGPRAGSVWSREEFEAALSGYYQVRGWDAYGRIPRDRVAELLERLGMPVGEGI